MLGVDWSSQRRRIVRDPVLAEVAMSVVITATDIDPKSRRPRTSAMLALLLSHLNGWLFGISVNRVKEGIRDDLIRYQRDCYHVLYRAFLERAETAVTPTWPIPIASCPATATPTSPAALPRCREPATGAGWLSRAA